jgi:hypothetical protein
MDALAGRGDRGEENQFASELFHVA